MSGYYWKLKVGQQQKRYDPNQPRVPAGQSGGGQWTSIGGGPRTWPSKRELPDQWNTTHHDEEGRIDPASLAGAVRQAVAERASRATHGYTGTNAFFIVDDEIYAWNDYDKIPRSKRVKAIPAHSHSGENWEDYQKRTGRREEFQPHNYEDVRLFLKGFRDKTSGTASVLIMADGRMEVLEILPSTDWSVFKLGAKRLEKLLHTPYAEQVPGVSVSETDRKKLRAFAEQYGLGYHEGVW